MSALQKMIGKKITSVKGLDKGSEEVVFFFSNGRAIFHHYQDCCENVDLNDFDLSGELLGSTILSAEEIQGESGDNDICESFTWTFYKIETSGGGLFMRWLGCSNGYYSEAVDVDWIDE